MFPFLSENQKAGFNFHRMIEKPFEPQPTPEEKEAQEAAWREEMGDEYIEDRPATRQEIRDCLNRLKLKSI